VTNRDNIAICRTAVCAVVLASVMPCVWSQGVSAVATLDRKSLTGSWYEIARLPNKREKHCAADAIELIALGDKPKTQLQLVDGCTDVKGYKDQWNFTATSKKRDSSGALKVGFFPLSRKYWLIATGPVVPVEALPSAKKDPTPVVANPASASTTSQQPDASAGAMPKATEVNGAPMPQVAPPPPPPPTGYAWTLFGTPNHKQLWIYARKQILDGAELDQIKAQASAMGFNSAKLITSPQTQK
jgi:lipocalin